jgi:hypothetical protein
MNVWDCYLVPGPVGSMVMRAEKSAFINPTCATEQGCSSFQPPDFGTQPRQAEQN